jgi:selenocysteine-specific elongation factor
MPAAAAAVRRVILGTAGHIDHGKTTLVERLTGIRTDRLKEEQERGMTIDVGYAELRLPDGAEVGFLDVPGHERLVRTMVAGATAMDLALLVVAADDGPMPQTREHVEILDLLGIRRLVVALTKVDLVDEETALLAEEEVRALLAGTCMEGAPILRVSSATGAGIPELKAAIAAAIPAPKEEAEDVWAFRMPVLRGFLAPGRGAVVTGIPVAGRVADGEDVEVLPAGWRSRVRGVQVHHRDATEARAGHRAALALADIQVDKVKRGMVVATAGVLKPSTRLAVRLRLSSALKKPLEHRDMARLHLGSDQVVVRVHVLEGARLDPGAVSAVELESDKPVVAAPGDHFVLRAENASATLGGGVVIEILAARLPRRRQGLIQSLLERSKSLGDPEAVTLGQLQAAGDAGADVHELAAATALRPEALPAILERLKRAGSALPVGRAGRWIHAAAFERVIDRVEAAVKALHEKDVAVGSLALSAVRTASGRLEPTVLDAAVEALTARGALQRTPTGSVRHRAHSSELPDADRERCAKVLVALAAGKGQPPGPEDLEATLGLPAPQVLRALRLLESRGTAFKAGDFWFDATWLAEAKARLAAFAKEHGGFTPADARTVLDSTRKWVIPLLEALDKAGFTRRVGEKRVVRG